MNIQTHSPRSDALRAEFMAGTGMVDFRHIYELARTLERELVAAKRSLAIADETIIDKASENARLREALEAAGNSLSAACGLLETYPRSSQRSISAAERAARAALVQS